MALPTTKELDESLPFLTPHERDEIDRLLAGANLPIWTPQPGPQTLAYHSPADEVYYGGAAGGGKSDLLLGLAVTSHRRSLILRREYTQLKGLIDRSREIIPPSLGRFNANDNVWRLNDGRTIEFGAVKQPEDWHKFQGRPRDFLAFDELPHFLLSQVRALGGWNRTTLAGQRCRTVGAGNPPTSAEQRWVIDEWAPWLDKTFPEPAAAGELRWYVVEKDKTRWLKTGDPVVIDGRTIKPKSRTFIPASVRDNALLMATGYEHTLLSMPEPLRSILMGDFQAGIEDDPWQLIPTAWVEAAQARWRDRPSDGAKLTAAGVDVAHGGADRTVIAKVYSDLWFAPFIVYDGAQTPDGATAAKFVYDAIRMENLGALVNIDAIGYGAPCYEACARAKMRAAPINFGEGTPATDKTGILRFRNVRAFAYWSLRELLEPANGFRVALSPDKELLQELTALRWGSIGGVIKIDEKADVKALIGRSPDKADAVALANIRPISGGHGETWSVRS